MSQARAPRRFRFFRALFVVLGIAVPVIGLELPQVWEWADFDPQPLLKMRMFTMWCLPLGAMLLLVWVLALSGWRWVTRLSVVGLAVAAAAGFFACVKEVDLTGNVGLRFVYIWQDRPGEHLAEHRRQSSGGDSLPAMDLAIDPVRDFPRYRGLAADGSVKGVKLAQDWRTQAPQPVWKQPCGGGFAGFAVAGNVAITLEQRGNDEAVVCYDRATGHERWVQAYPAAFRHVTGTGPRSTPTIADGDVYSLGATGWLTCVNGRTGERRWATNILEDNGAKNVAWAMTGSPLIVGKLVVVNPGIDPNNNADKALAAYDRSTGKPVWAKGSYAAGYSSPQLVRLAGREQVLLFDAGGLAGFDPTDGRELWRYPWATFQDMNVIQPLVIGDDRVFISSETANGCALLRVRIEGGSFHVEPVWANRSLCSKFANPVQTGGCIYGLSTDYLVCVDAGTGNRHWRSSKTFGHGQVLAVGDVLVVQSEKGEVVLVKASTEGYKELGRFEAFDDPKTWNTPALAAGRLYLRNHQQMGCWELPVEP